jgi:hypothetical protein
MDEFGDYCKEEQKNKNFKGKTPVERTTVERTPVERTLESSVIETKNYYFQISYSYQIRYRVELV